MEKEKRLSFSTPIQIVDPDFVDGDEPGFVG